VAEFRPGDHVRHEQFGEGVVVGYQKTKNDAEVVVAFEGEGVKRFLLSFANIEKV
jgi:DNA helicase-2/ATP-dependent DNA helicase PcrA